MTDLTLKIKRITMAAEARGIKVNEQRLGRKLRRLLPSLGGDPPYKHAGTISSHRDMVHSLRAHRLKVVRPEARAMHLACNFLRGRDYRAIEPISRWPETEEKFALVWKALWGRVEYHVLKHRGQRDERVVRQEFAAWHDEAKIHARHKLGQATFLAHARARSLAAKAARRQSLR